MAFEVPQNGVLRQEILEKSIHLEELLGSMLKSILKVSSEKSKTLGYGSSTLSFSSKVNLLYDLDYLDKEAYTKFQIFIPIRNHFIHRQEAANFTSVLKALDNGLRNKFIKLNLEDELKSRKEIAQKHNFKDVEIAQEFIRLHSEISEKFIANETSDLSGDQVELFYYFQWVLFESNLSRITVRSLDKLIEKMKVDVITNTLTLDKMSELFKSAIRIAILESGGSFNVSKKRDLLLIHNYNKSLVAQVDNAFEKTKLDILRIFDERLNKPF